MKQVTDKNLIGILSKQENIFLIDSFKVEYVGESTKLLKKYEVYTMIHLTSRSLNNKYLASIKDRDFLCINGIFYIEFNQSRFKRVIEVVPINKGKHGVCGLMLGNDLTGWSGTMSELVKHVRLRKTLKLFTRIRILKYGAKDAK